MFKKTVEYENFEGKKIIRDLYFNLTKMELLDLQKKHNNNYEEYLKRAVESKNDQILFEAFKELVLLSYGEVDEKTGRFLKSEDIRNSFEHSEEFSDFFIELLEDRNNEKLADKFLISTFPKEFSEKIKSASSTSQNVINQNK